MLNKEFVKSLLKEQKLKFLSKDRGIEREALAACKNLITLPHALVISGMRRTGKSTLLLQIAKEYYESTLFYYINFDDERWLGFEAKDFNLVYEALLESEGSAKTFFIDEIQNIKGFEAFVRRFVDDGFKFIITGSNSDMLSRELGTRLTGRHVMLHLSPFSWNEFLTANNLSIPHNQVLTTDERVAVLIAFDNYCTFGGMPEYVIYHSEEILTGIYDDLVIKDIAVRFNIPNSIIMRELYMYLLTNSTARYSYNSLQSKLNIQSRSTIINYLDYLEMTYFAAQVRKFDFSLQKSLKNDKKLYIIDNGFITFLSQTFTRDKGKLLENLIFNHLSKSSEVYFYSAKYECDFITAKNRVVQNLFQVCYMLNDTNKQREINGLIEAMEYCSSKYGYIISYDEEEIIKVDDKEIKVIPAWKFLRG